MTEFRVMPSEGFGQACLRALIEATTGVATPAVGLPTGNTPVPLFEALKTAVESGRVDVSSWRPFAIDEYGGPRDHPCSNRAFFRRHWEVIPGARPVEQFDPEAADLDVECARMAGALGRAGGLTVALLGVGMNGHLAFNEPGSLRDSIVRRVILHEESRRSGAACWGEEVPEGGLTLGLSELLGARRVVVIAFGSAKASIVSAAHERPQTPDVPASFARGEHVTWVVDVAAAGSLGRGQGVARPS